MDSPASNQEVGSNDLSTVMSGSVSAPVTNSGISSQGDSTICNLGPPAFSNMVSLDKSPMKTANLLTQTFALRHDNADAYTIDQICTARITKMQPSYLYLTNVIADENTRATELESMLVKIGIEYLDLYPNFLNDKTPPTVTGVSIPPLTHSLRQWVQTTHEQTSSTLRDLFTCVLRPDPLSSPKFYHLYKTREAERGGEAGVFLRSRVTEWNRSQMLLAEVLNTALKNAEASNPSPTMRHLLKLIRIGWKHHSPDATQMRGHHMFWVLKNILHSDPQQSIIYHRDNYSRHRDEPQLAE